MSASREQGQDRSIHIGNTSGGNIQIVTGNNSSATASGGPQQDPKAHALALLGELKDALSRSSTGLTPNDAAAGRLAVDAIQEQVASAAPDTGRIRAMLSRLRDLAITATGLAQTVETLKETVGHLVS